VLAESRDEIHRIAAEREKGRHLETLGRMASGVAHDFNNVLTGIRLSAELARLKLPPEQSGEDLETIQRTVAQGGELVKSLLLFARGETAAAQRFELNDLVREMEPVLRKLASDRQRMCFELGPEAMEIMGDRTGVARILSNLVVNARDAMPCGGDVTVATAITLRKMEGARPAVVLRVSDTGAGISPDVLPRIFEPFYTTKTEGRGTGLGLTIVQTFVQKMGGEISVESEVGRGTTFEIRLPLAA
jgi:signal transduction histidine kinase